MVNILGMRESARRIERQRDTVHERSMHKDSKNTIKEVKK